MNVFLMILFGALSGIFGGMGMGGGTTLIPLLTLFLGFSQILAQGLNLISFLPMSLITIIIHAKNGFVKWDYVFFISLIGCVFSLLGSYLANAINTSILKYIFGGFLIAFAMYEIFFQICNGKKNS